MGNFRCSIVLLLTACMFFLHESKAQDDSPNLDRWLSVFFRELNRNVSPEILEESIIQNKDMLVLVKFPESVKASYPLGVRLGSQAFCKDGESVAFATELTPTQSFSVACMQVKGHEATPLGGHTPTPRDVYYKSLTLLLKLYPNMNVTLPFTSEEIQTFLKKKGHHEQDEVIALEKKIEDIQSRENYLSRNIPSLENLHERAFKSLQEEEEDKKDISSELLNEISEDEKDDWGDEGFNDSFFNEENPWLDTTMDEPNPRLNSNDILDMTNDGDEEKTTDDGGKVEEEKISTVDYYGERDPQSARTESPMDSAFEHEGDSKNKPYKIKYETVLGILLTILAVITIIVLIYIYRRQQRSRVFEISGQSTPSSPITPSERNIFEPQILQCPKDDPESLCVGPEETATIKSGNLLAVKLSSSRHSSVSSTRSNPFLGAEAEIPKIDGPPGSAPNSPSSRKSTSSFQPQN